MDPAPEVEIAIKILKSELCSTQSSGGYFVSRKQRFRNLNFKIGSKSRNRVLDLAREVEAAVQVPVARETQILDFQFRCRIRSLNWPFEDCISILQSEESRRKRRKTPKNGSYRIWSKTQISKSSFSLVLIGNSDL